MTTPINAATHEAYRDIIDRLEESKEYWLKEYREYREESWKYYQESSKYQEIASLLHLELQHYGIEIGDLDTWVAETKAGERRAYYMRVCEGVPTPGRKLSAATVAKRQDMMRIVDLADADDESQQVALAKTAAER